VWAPLRAIRPVDADGTSARDIVVGTRWLAPAPYAHCTSRCANHSTTAPFAWPFEAATATTEVAVRPAEWREALGREGDGLAREVPDAREFVGGADVQHVGAATVAADAQPDNTNHHGP
jgi:hypothetical protein